MTSEWPQRDPITGRMICENCFRGIHYHEMRFRRNSQGKMENYYVACERLGGKAEHACTGECDCIHRSEETWAALEKTNQRNAKKAKCKAEKEALESSPLRADNTAYRKYEGA